jgi:Protein-L-isoaspartate(D-aspartate) O-methyltransferase (PCMT)
VISVELDPELAKRGSSVLRQAGYRAQLVVGDGRDGWAAGAPYHRIIVTASASEIPHAWLEQTVEDGRIQVPLRLRNSLSGQAIPTLGRRGSELHSISVLCGGFMPLRENAADAGVRPSSFMPLRENAADAGVRPSSFTRAREYQIRLGLRKRLPPDAAARRLFRCDGRIAGRSFRSPISPFRLRSGCWLGADAVSLPKTSSCSCCGTSWSCLAGNSDARCCVRRIVPCWRRSRACSQRASARACSSRHRRCCTDIGSSCAVSGRNGVEARSAARR